MKYGLRFRVGALCCGAILVAGPLSAQDEPPAAAPAADETELRYAEGLTRLGLPEYAEMVLAKVGGGTTKAKVLQLQIYLARGQFDQVKAIIAKEPSQNSEDTWAMKMSLADANYAWGNYTEAKALYDGFFQKYSGVPPPGIAEFYLNSAYRYAQMLVLMGQPKAALTAYENALKGSPPKHVRRQIMADMGELMLKLVETAPPAERSALIAKVNKLCDELLWVQDLWFGKAIVMKAHIKLLNKDVDGAMKLIDDYREQLVGIDQALKQQAGPDEDLTKISPMAECRYLLGVILQEEAMRQLNAGGDKARIVELLSGKEDTVKLTRTSGALQHFLNVFVRYPSTSWAPDAGVRYNQVKEILESRLGRKVDSKVSREQWAEVEKSQFQSARSLFNQQRWQEAADGYLKSLNVFPESPLAILALGDLCRCYIEMNDDLYADLVLRYLAERFSAREAFVTPAGDQVLGIADAYTERKAPDRADAAYQVFTTGFKTHPRTPALMLRTAEQQFAAKNYAGAMATYERVIQGYPNSPLYFAALSRVATCHRESGDRESEIKTLTVYIRGLEAKDYPGQPLIMGKYRLATAYRESGETNLPAAIVQYNELARLLSGDLGKYQKTADEAKANVAILESALFYSALGLARLPATPGKPDADSKQQAIKGYEALVAKFPKSQFAPAALSQAGTLWTILQNPDEAKKAFERLQRGYPESDESKNAKFLLGMNLLKLSRRREAVDVFKEMFSDQAGKYSDTQILTAGNELLKAGEYEIAIQAYDRLLQKVQERSLREPALAGRGRALVEMGKYDEGAKSLDALLKEYKNSGFTVEVCFALARAYSNLGESESDELKRIGRINSAMGAMKTARRYLQAANDKGGMARSDLEVARIYERLAKAAQKFNAPASAAEARNNAIATYQILILRADPQESAVQPHIQEAFHECIPLMLQTERWQDAFDDCNQYLKAFPSGAYAPEVSSWLNKAKAKLATQGAAPPKPGP